MFKTILMKNKDGHTLKATSPSIVTYFESEGYEKTEVVQPKKRNRRKTRDDYYTPSGFSGR